MKIKRILFCICVLFFAVNGLMTIASAKEKDREILKIDKTIFEYRIKDGGVYIVGFLEKYKEYHPTATHKGSIYIPKEIEYMGKTMKVLGIEEKAFSCKKDSRNTMEKTIIFEGLIVEKDAFEENPTKLILE